LRDPNGGTSALRDPLNVSYDPVKRLAGLQWVSDQGTGRRRIKRISAESVRRLRDASSH